MRLKTLLGLTLPPARLLAELPNPPNRRLSCLHHRCLRRRPCPIVKVDASTDVSRLANEVVADFRRVVLLMAKPGANADERRRMTGWFIYQRNQERLATLQQLVLGEKRASPASAFSRPSSRSPRFATPTSWPFAMCSTPYPRACAASKTALPSTRLRPATSAS